jgi:hypothetical protein
MTTARIAASLIGAGMLLGIVCLGSAAPAEKLEKTFYTASTTLWLEVSDAALRKLLPEGWEPIDVSSMGGSNLVVTFTDILASETPDGKPGETGRLVSFSAPVQKSGTDEKTAMILGGLVSDASFAPGPYGNYTLAKVRLDRHLQTEAAAKSIREEAWQFVGDNGATLEFRLKFSGGEARHLKLPASTNSSAAKPDLRRINKSEIVMQPVRFRDTDSVKDVVLKAAGPQLSPLFDGSEQLIAIFSNPSAVLQVLVP